MEAFEIIAKAINLSDKSLQDIVQALQVELQDREIRGEENDSAIHSE